MANSSLILAIDVGTGSARAGLFDISGKMLATATEPIRMWNPQPDHYEQSSEDIWHAITVTVKQVLAEANVSGDQIAGISFDATCSLVVLDQAGKPLAVNSEGDNERNIIVWMDHRAITEADAITAGNYDVLKYVGGTMSPEMETPKLKWLKSHLPQTWNDAGKFLDLADYLTYRASGVDARSYCTVVCKWTYLGHEGEGGRWDTDYLRAIGIDDVFDGKRVANDIRPMGAFLGNLTPKAAQELGLSTNCAVGVGIIDAHAGGLGVLGSVWENDAAPEPAQLETALALIGGTSNCHMAVSVNSVFVPGIWGPYYGAMVPGLWLLEGGQTSAGSTIDHVIADHAAAPELFAEAEATGKTPYEILNQVLSDLMRDEGVPHSCFLTRDIHVLGDFLGNRCPHADPLAKGIVDGITLDKSRTSLAVRYYAAVQAVAYGSREIVEALNRHGMKISSLYVTGGGTKNPIWLQEHADATGLTLVLPKEPEAVLLGTAMLAATACGVYPTIHAAMQGMSQRGSVITPNPATAKYHAAKFACYQDLYNQQVERRHVMRFFENV